MTGKDTTRYGHPCRTIFLPEQVNCYLHTKHVLCHTSRRSGPCKRLHEAWTSRPADILQETRKGSTTQCKYTTTDSPRKKKPHKKFSLTFTAEQEILSYEVRKSPIRTPASHFRDSNKWNCSIMPRQRYALACCSLGVTSHQHLRACMVELYPVGVSVIAWAPWVPPLIARRRPLARTVNRAVARAPPLFMFYQFTASKSAVSVAD